MHLSIRKFLLINLLLAIVLTNMLTIVGNYLLDRKDIQRHLDSMLIVNNLNYQALLGDALRRQDLQKAQHIFDHIPDDLRKYCYNSTSKKDIAKLAGNLSVQVIGKDGQLLLHSKNAPSTPLIGKDGKLTNMKVENENWRVFSVYNKNLEVTVTVSERHTYPSELTHLLVLDNLYINDLYIMLLMFPLSGLLIWFIVGQGLNILNRITTEVSNREPSYLQPVKVKRIPREIKPLVSAINQLFARLQAAFEREKRFAADAAHELRTPLAALKTQAQVALKTKDSKERTTALHNVIKGVDRSSHTVQQLLTLSRLVPEEAAIHDIGSIDLPKLAAEVIAHLVPAALEKNIELELEHPQPSIFIKGNATALSILLRNLVDNAIRYIQEKGHIKVYIATEKTGVVLRVIDNGPGIPKELRTRAFERFFRILGSKASGSGLGLAIVQEIATLHQATVHLGSPENGQGLQVEVVF